MKKLSSQHIRVLCLGVLGTILMVGLLWPSIAFASAGTSGKHPPHQARTFIHLAETFRPATVHPGCSTTTCNNLSAYQTDCAGQSWDSWWVVTSNSIYLNGQYEGYAQLWWSQTCQTNWGRIVPQGAYSRLWVDLTLQDCTPLNRCQCSAYQQNCSEVGEITPGNWISRQLYAPVANACVDGQIVLSTNPSRYANALTGQFHSAPNACMA